MQNKHFCIICSRLQVINHKIHVLSKLVIQNVINYISSTSKIRLEKICTVGKPTAEIKYNHNVRKRKLTIVKNYHKKSLKDLINILLKKMKVILIISIKLDYSQTLIVQLLHYNKFLYKFTIIFYNTEEKIFKTSWKKQ